MLCDFAGSSLNSKRLIWNDLFAIRSVLFELSTRNPPYNGLGDKRSPAGIQLWIFPSVEQLLFGRVITKCWMVQYQSANHQWLPPTLLLFLHP